MFVECSPKNSNVLFTKSDFLTMLNIISTHNPVNGATIKD